MKVLTIREPWASLIAQGVKRVETRSWPTRYRGPLYLHAGSAPLPQSDPALSALLALLPDPTPAYGQILARCVLADCIPMDGAYIARMQQEQPVEFLCGDYGPGRYAWLLEQVEPLAVPLPCKGRLGLWNYQP